MHVHWGTEIKIVDSLFLSPALYWLSERTNAPLLVRSRSLWRVTLRVICSVHCIFFHCSNTVAVAFFSISDSYSVDFIQMLVLCVRRVCMWVCVRSPAPPYRSDVCTFFICLHAYMCMALCVCVCRYITYIHHFSFLIPSLSIKILSLPLSHNRLFFFFHFQKKRKKEIKKEKQRSICAPVE